MALVCSITNSKFPPSILVNCGKKLPAARLLTADTPNALIPSGSKSFKEAVCTCSVTISALAVLNLPAFEDENSVSPFKIPVKSTIFKNTIFDTYFVLEKI